MAIQSFKLFDYLKAQQVLFREATRQLTTSRGQESFSNAAEWLPDNFYLVQQSLRQVREDMPPGFYRQLPKLPDGPLQGLPRIYAIAQELVVTSATHLELDHIKRFLHFYQELTPLTMGELWALPLMLRLGILECLAQTLCRITGLERAISLPPMTLPPATTEDEIVANCIISLRMLSTQDWQVFFEDVSRVEHILRDDPANTYARMDGMTRDRYRKVIEELAQATAQDEQDIARKAIGLAQANVLATPRTAHVGYYLLDAGRTRLETQLGYHVPLGARVRRWILNHPTLVYLGSIGLFTFIILLGGMGYVRNTGAPFLQWIATGLLLLIPALTVSVSLVNWLVTLAFPPRVLPKMDFEEGIPAEYKTLVVVPSLLSSAAAVKSLLEELELHFLRNQDEHLYFALLTDLPDTPQPRRSGEDTLVEQAASGVRALNKKYHRAGSNPFYLFYRDPKWNPREEQWMGWERKRGKLHQLNLLLRGSGETAFTMQIGDLPVLREIKYVITLDTDTMMPRTAAHRLVATLAHPLNRAEFDPLSSAVIAGYTILQPGIEITSTSENRSRFTRIFAGDIGLDLYTRAASNAYQDLFGEGVYVGKGIYDIDAFERTLAGRMPENALLSHDLIEGIHGRVALVTDIVLFEEYPPHYFVYLRRSRRWIRGDWQLLPWLLPRVPSVEKGMIPNRLAIIDRWKILDNLRRSLLSPALLILFVAGWLWLPGSPLAWTLAGLLTLAVPVLTGLVSSLIQSVKGKSWHAERVFHPLQNGIVRWVLALAFILYESFVTLGGVATTLVRLVVTRRHLLQWTSYADTVRVFAGRVTWRQMLTATLSSAALAVLIVLFKPASLFVAMPLLIAWLLSPEIAYWLNRPNHHAPTALSADERQQLRRLARRTWLFFEQFVGPEDHWLPPDHFQEAPRGIVAHSTSPTDLGLLLLSTLGAYDLGYISLLDLSARLRDTFESMGQLETYQGHFLNWYDTRSLEPLLPRYVSTVDSGNLVACLRTLWQGCQTLPHKPVVRWQNWEGLLDTISLLDEIVNNPIAADRKSTIAPLRAHLAEMQQEVWSAQDDPDAWAPLLTRLSGEKWNELSQLLLSLVESGGAAMDAETLHRLNLVADQVQNHLYRMQREIEQLSPWLLLMSQPPDLFARSDAPPAIRDAWQVLQDALPTAPHLEELVQVYQAGLTRLAELQVQLDQDALFGSPDQVQKARDWCAHLSDKLESAATTVGTLLVGLQDMGERSERYFRAMDFGFLFDPQRQLFHIGYNVTAEKLDGNYYDLLASEARIASLVSIAENQIPTSHWLHLGRPLTQVDGARVLLSWGGTMFEYLMPTLLMQSYEGTFLHQSCLAAVDVQIEYGKQKNVPWGISESGYYAFDANQNYQYRSFGVPGLGFKRDLDEDLVIAPYASLLALSLRPRKVMENVAHLDKLQMLGMYGLYESVDFSPSRLTLGNTSAIVRSYMAHHQGMILLALDNYLCEDIMVRRFHADALMQSVELLLQEKIPYDVLPESPQPGDARGTQRDPLQREIVAAPWSVPARSCAPQVHFLSNGRYGVMITSAGAGYSCWQSTPTASSIDLTRWRADTTCEDWGTWIYLQDVESGDLWSAAQLPRAAMPARLAYPSGESQTVQFYPHMAEFQRSDHGIGLTMEITVAPDDDVEIRRISLTNHTDRVRHIALTSYGEVILAPQAVDARHPAFNKMFVESEYVQETNALLFRRRPRSTSEEPIHLAHSAIVSPGQRTTGAHETDRAQFLGRGQTLRAPAALSQSYGALSGTTGATLDPIMALRQEIELQPHASAQVSFITVAASSREKLLELARHYQDGSVIVRAFEQARVRAESELRQLDLTTTDLESFQQLLSALLYPQAALRAEPATLEANRLGQPGLWPFSISGDHPILLVRMHTSEDLALVQQAIQAHAYWRNRHIQIDLAILNEQGTTYGQELRAQLQRVLVHQNSEDWFNRRGGIFILYADQLSDSTRVLLEAAARVVLDRSKGSLAQQLELLRLEPTRLPLLVSVTPDSKVESTPRVAHPGGLLFDNGLGGFSADGREYVIYLEPDRWTPAPWVNVIANPDFGFTVSEAGAGYTWFGNSSENRLTPWANDPLSNPPGEALYLRDEETAAVWSPTPLPCRAPAPYLIRHGAGYSIFEHNSHGLVQRLRLFAAPDAPVKVIQLRLENTWKRTRRITATFYAEWVLGVTREGMQQYVVSEFDGDHQALLAHNCYNTEFGECVAFVAASKRLHGLTADRTEFLGRMGSLSHPAALDRIGLASAVRPGLDPCAALQLHIDLKAGQAEEIFFLVGEGANRAAAIELIEQYQKTEQIEAAWDKVTEFWDNLLGSVQVQTPNPAMDLLLNRWLLYQTLSCRIWGRTAFYQSSGAFGFRDQLQDVMALIHAAPQLAREHILLAAKHQFEAGDVLHWWHPPSGRGVRTRISDDMLWLPFVTAHYVTATGDTTILDEEISFRKAAPLEAGETERYSEYASTPETYTLYEHCRRALEKGTTSGIHGLPLMGSGDWNDGMNRVGIEGRGESVWLGWFLFATLTGFAELCDGKGDNAQGATYRQHANDLGKAIEANTWDGAWYRRAYYDDGTPLGSSENADCQIDSIAQSWAILSGAGDPARAAEAMESVASMLYRPDDQLLLILTPPFDKTARDPGYIKGYPPGIRENGGQYTHAALWVLWAFAEMGQGDRAEALFRMLNPIYHSDTPDKVARYVVEPYVVAGDVYSASSHIGHGGWTWYTGSAGWMYRLGVEAILGVSRVGNLLKVNPCIPKDWRGYEVVYQFGATRYLITVGNPDGVNQGIRTVLLDGKILIDTDIPLSDDGEQHNVQVLLGQTIKEKVDERSYS